MSTTLTPASTAELSDAVRSAPRVIAAGAGTKPRLSAVDAVRISTSRLRGIVDYEPSEFTFTALAGTPLRDLASVLSARGQYLPFDPMWVDAGATLGGTVASGVSGPGRFRFGGLRDSILSVQFVDGEGRRLRLGGKVVKNAAGFDVPKFMVGSLGRFGIIAEATFKVFPRPPNSLTLALDAVEPESVVRILTAAANARWELDAVDVLPDGRSVALRACGPAPALAPIARDILARWPGRILSTDEADALWLDLRECLWAGGAAVLLKVALAPAAVADLIGAVEGLGGARLHLTSGGNVALVSLASADQVAPLGTALCTLALPALTLRGDAPLWLGAKPRFRIEPAVKAALGAETRFPGLDD